MPRSRPTKAQQDRARATLLDLLTGMTETALGNAMGVTQETINGYKSGRVGISFERIHQLARIAEKNPAEILGFDHLVPIGFDALHPPTVLAFLLRCGIRESIAQAVASAPGRWTLDTIYYVHHLPPPDRTPIEWRQAMDRIQSIPADMRPSEIGDAVAKRLPESSAEATSARSKRTPKAG